jgi:flagellar biosynthesis GTPase FlhF
MRVKFAITDRDVIRRILRVCTEDAHILATRRIQTNVECVRRMPPEIVKKSDAVIFGGLFGYRFPRAII